LKITNDPINDQVFVHISHIIIYDEIYRSSDGIVLRVNVHPYKGPVINCNNVRIIPSNRYNNR